MSACTPGNEFYHCRDVSIPGLTCTKSMSHVTCTSQECSTIRCLAQDRRYRHHSIWAARYARRVRWCASRYHPPQLRRYLEGFVVICDTVMAGAANPQPSPDISTGCNLPRRSSGRVKIDTGCSLQSGFLVSEREFRFAHQLASSIEGPSVPSKA